MQWQTIVTRKENGMGLITINREDVRNALNKQSVDDMREALKLFQADEEVRVVVFTGVGDKAFAAGADISQIRDRTLFDALQSHMQTFYREIEQFDKPTIAAINGFALGGGCELALACDIRIASTRAKMGLPELNIGIIPGAGGTQRLARLVGRGRAIDMILTGTTVTAEEALQFGLVTRVVPLEDLLQAAAEVAEKIQQKGPLALRLAKLAIQAGLDTDLQSGLVIERLAQAVLYTTEDKREGTTAFLEKRKPQFTGN